MEKRLKIIICLALALLCVLFPVMAVLSFVLNWWLAAKILFCFLVCEEVIGLAGLWYYQSEEWG